MSDWLAKLEAAGVPAAAVQKLRHLAAAESLPALNEQASVEQAEARARATENLWRKICRTWQSERLAPDQWVNAWETVYAQWDDRIRPRPMYSPDLQQIQRTRIAQWAAELGITGFEQFHRWSVQHPEQFWAEAVRRLEIEFAEFGDRVACDLNDPATCQWFPDAKLNIASSCFLADESTTAIRFRGPLQSKVQQWTYGDLKKRTDQVSWALQKSGFKIADAIAVVLPMTAESIAIYLGIVQAGMRVVSIADSFAEREIRNRLHIAQTRAVFTYDTVFRAGKSLPLYDRVRGAADEAQVIVLSLEGAAPGKVPLRDQDVRYPEFLELAESEAPFAPVICASDDCTNILFSSGTTGDPKAIPWTHLTPIKCATDGALHQNLGPGSVAAWPTNLGWMMGPWLIYATLINRGTLALYEDAPMGEDFGRFVEQAEIQMLGVVPTIVKSWRATRCLENFDWRAIQCYSSTGEASQPEDMLYLSALAGMKPVIEYCGGTEIGGGYLASTPVQPNVPSVFSSPAMGLDFEIHAEAGTAAPALADEGELFLVGPSLGLSRTLLNRDHAATYYAECPSSLGAYARLPNTVAFADLPETPCGVAEDTDERCPRQLRRHGDYLKRLPGGYFVAGGRSDDTMNLGGIKVSSAEIERVLNLLPGVRETAAVAVKGRGGSGEQAAAGPEQLFVFVVLQDGGPEMTDLHAALNGQLKSELNPLFKISEIKIVESLPRTASNKVMRRTLRDQLLQQ